MCVWTGYIGPRKAAAESLGMLQRIEGIWSGFYTGLAVLGGDGKLRHAKTTGYSRYWLEQFRLADFPGQIGLAHSRTDSGGDARWGHPFVSSDGQLALIAQGSQGIFGGERGTVEAIGNRLLSAGCSFSSAVPKINGRHPVLADGSEVHSSDVHAEAVAYAYSQSRDHQQALAAHADLPSEAVYVSLFQDCPDTLWLANVNQRCLIGYAPGEVFLASSALAFPERVTHVEELPGNVIASVQVSGLRILQSLSARYQPIEEPPSGLEKPFLAYLAEHPWSLLAHIVDQAIKPCYPFSNLGRRATAGHRLLEKLVRDGQIEDRHLEYQTDAGICGLITQWHLCD
ncbi:MAG: hypothetical protein WCT05_05245 [Lentisphaeria bacterium]